MNLATWLRIAAITVGTLALGLLVWFGNQQRACLLGFGDCERC